MVNQAKETRVNRGHWFFQKLMRMLAPDVPSRSSNHVKLVTTE
jgi:hypothetical protein